MTCSGVLHEKKITLKNCYYSQNLITNKFVENISKTIFQHKSDKKKLISIDTTDSSQLNLVGLSFRHVPIINSLLLMHTNGAVCFVSQ